MPRFIPETSEGHLLGRMVDHRVLRDTKPPEEIDAICFFGQTHENDPAALKKIAELWKQYRCPVLVGQCDPIDEPTNNDPDYHFVVRGSEVWRDELVSYGVDRTLIWIYSMSTKLPASTDAEALGMAELIVAAKLPWKRLVVTVPVLHATRAFVSLVAACKKNGLDDVAIWSAPPDALDWDERVCHSGGKRRDTRMNHIGVCNTKMLAYCEKGDHLTGEEILKYLANRKNLLERDVARQQTRAAS